MDDVGQTLLNWASAFGTQEMVEFLCERGADVNKGLLNGALIIIIVFLIYYYFYFDLKLHFHLTLFGYVIQVRDHHLCTTQPVSVGQL